MNEWMNLFAWQKQWVEQEHRGTITACTYRCPGQQLYKFTKLKALEYKTYEDIYTKHKHREEKKTLKNIHKDNLLQYGLVVITM